MFIHKHAITLGIITIGQWTIPYRIIAYICMYVHVYDYKRNVSAINKYTMYQLLL